MFTRSLLAWYCESRRDLPWRRTGDPYKIWLSEIMLQQTTVDVVIPYYENFIRKFGTIKAIAKASESELLHLWQGLGYYNRIRNFHKAAKIIVTEQDGLIPRTKEELIRLPGLGEYTAAAVASIAFAEPVAVVDGNVKRVLARVFVVDDDINSSRATKFFAAQAGDLLDTKNPGDFNQAMMELGATVCTKGRPRCLFCPVRGECQAYLKGQVHLYPVKKKKMKYVDEKLFCLLFKKGGKVLIRQRGKDEIMAGLWEFPLKRTKKVIPDALRSSAIRDLAHLSPIKHTIMNHRMTIYPVVKSGSVHGGRWVNIHDLGAYPLTTVTRKVLRHRPELFAC